MSLSDYASYSTILSDLGHFLIMRCIAQFFRYVFLIVHPSEKNICFFDDANLERLRYGVTGAARVVTP